VSKGIRIRLVATDFDETLTDGKGWVNPRLIEVLGRFVASGGVLLVASGRVLLSLKRIVGSWQVPCFLAATNGSVLLRWPEEKRFYAHELPHSIVEETLETGCGLGRPHLLYDDKLYAAGTEEAVRYSTLLNVPFHHTPSLLSHLKPGVRAVSWRCTPEAAVRLYQKLQEQLAGRASVTMSHTVLVDVNPPGSEKGVALRHVQEICGIKRAHTLALGDAPNDLSLFGEADHRAAVANAAPGLKAEATYVSSAERGEGALQCLRHFGLG